MNARFSTHKSYNRVYHRADQALPRFLLWESSARDLDPFPWIFRIFRAHIIMSTEDADGPPSRGKIKIEKTTGNTSGLRTWIEYGLKHAKNELGRADYRVTDYAERERWWEIIFSTYLLVGFQCSTFHFSAHDRSSEQTSPTTPVEHFAEHPW